jgi:hypothetical protein
VSNFLVQSRSCLTWNRQDFDDAVAWHDYLAPCDDRPHSDADIDEVSPNREHLPPSEISGTFMPRGAIDMTARYDIEGALPAASNSQENPGFSFDTIALHAYSSVDPKSLSLNSQLPLASDPPFDPDFSSHRTHGSNTL